MFLRYTNYDITPGGGADVYNNCFVNKQIFFDKIKYKTSEEMEDLLDSLIRIKEQNLLDEVIADIKEKVRIRKIGEAYNKKCLGMRAITSEVPMKRSKDERIREYVEKETKDAHDFIDQLDLGCSSYFLNKLIQSRISRYKENIKNYIVNNFGEEEYNKYLEGEDYNVTNF